MSRPTKGHIRMLFDISSPWSCIAYTILTRYKESGVWDFDLELVPIFLGGIMVATKNTPPSALKAPLYYVHHDQLRVSRRFGVDTRSPPGHPLNTSSLNQIRLLRTIAREEGQEVLHKCVGLIYHEFYSVQTLYTSRQFWDCLLPVLSSSRIDELLALSQSDENKEGVKADVIQAVEEYGMYGAPWFVATRAGDGAKDVFFGADKFEALAWWLGPEFPWRGPYPDGDDSVPITKINREARL